MSLKTIPDDQIKPIIQDAIDDAMNAMFCKLQDALGQDDGGVAAIFFSGTEEQKVNDLLGPMMTRYLAFEYAQDK